MDNLKIIFLILLITAFGVILILNFHGMLDSMHSSEKMRVADMGESMAQALENAAVNVLEKNLNPDFKTRGVAVINDRDENGVYLDETQIKEKIAREVAQEFDDYANAFNENIEIRPGENRDLFEYDIDIDIQNDINLGSPTARTGDGQRWANQVGDTDARDAQNIGQGDYPYYKATLNINFYSIIRTKNLVAREGVARENYEIQPFFTMNYPITVTIRHINTQFREMPAPSTP